MATPAVGEDIEALCGRCGQVWHVVMAKMGERIAKVETATAPGAAAGAKRGSAAPRRHSRRDAEPVAPTIPPFDPSKPPRPYTAKDVFMAGERLTHPAFGTGVVTGTPGPGKIEIAFPAGLRVLACAKAVSTLERPHTVSNAPISDRPPKL